MKKTVEYNEGERSRDTDSYPNSKAHGTKAKSDFTGASGWNHNAGEGDEGTEDLM